MARPATWGTFDKRPRIGHHLLYCKRRSRSANRLSFAGAEVTPTSAATGPATRVPSRSASPTLSLRVAVGALIACDLRKTPRQGMARAISALSPSFQHPSQYLALDSTAFRGSYYFSRRSNSIRVSSRRTTWRKCAWFRQSRRRGQQMLRPFSSPWRPTASGLPINLILLILCLPSTRLKLTLCRTRLKRCITTSCPTRASAFFCLTIRCWQDHHGRATVKGTQVPGVGRSQSECRAGAP